MMDDALFWALKSQVPFTPIIKLGYFIVNINITDCVWLKVIYTGMT